MNTTCCSSVSTPQTQLPANFQYSKLSRASIDVRSSADVSLVTADGDKVTISASSALQASLQTYDYRGRAQGQTVAVQGQQFQLTASSGFALSVEGSLDQEELNDIKKLLNTLSALGKDLGAGNTDQGLQRLTQLNQLDSIASFEAEFNYTRQITAVTASQLSVATAPQSPASSSAEASPSTPAADSFTAELSNAARRLEADGDFDKIPKRFAQLLKKLAHQLPLDEHEQKLAKKIHSEHAKHGRERHADEPSGAAS